VNEIPQDATYADRFVSKVDGPELLFQAIAEVLERMAMFLKRTPDTDHASDVVIAFSIF
jgi:hypothetical protein